MYNSVLSLPSTLYALRYMFYHLHSTLYVLPATLFNPHSMIYHLPSKSIYALCSTRYFSLIYALRSTIYPLSPSMFYSLHSTSYSLYALRSTIYPPSPSMLYYLRSTSYYSIYTLRSTLKAHLLGRLLEFFNLFLNFLNFFSQD